MYSSLDMWNEKVGGCLCLHIIYNNCKCVLSRCCCGDRCGDGKTKDRTSPVNALFVFRLFHTHLLQTFSLL